MERATPRPPINLSRIWIAASLLVVAALFALEALEAVDTGAVLADWWPAFIIGAGALQLALGRPRRWFGSAVLMLVGGVGLALTTGVLSSVTSAMWAVVFAALGLAVIVRGVSRRQSSLDTDRVDSLVLFGGREVASHSKSFRGGSVSSVFGGTELDLRDAELAPDATLEVLTAFGGTEISVPYGWRVELQGIPIFGGFENATAHDVDLSPDAPVLAVDAVALFGGIEVKH